MEISANRPRGTFPCLWLLTLLPVLQCVVPGCGRKAERVGRAHDFLKLEIDKASEGPGRSAPPCKCKEVHSLVVEVACDDSSRKLGLMNRESLPDDHGMLFIFRQGKRQSFWMKNTLIPLSIAFISDGGEVLQIEDMKPKDLRSTMSKQKVRCALEVNKGWFESHGINVGDRITGFREKVSVFRAS